MGATGHTMRIALAAAIAATVVAAWATPVVEAQRDPGFNQPGAAGNRGGGVDPGLNQPGAAGNRGGGGAAAATPVGYGGSARQVRVSDPGFNQPGAAGNAGRDPGLNQPGAAGNRRR